MFPRRRVRGSAENTTSIHYPAMARTFLSGVRFFALPDRKPVQTRSPQGGNRISKPAPLWHVNTRDGPGGGMALAIKTLPAKLLGLLRQGAF
jgi:hypothetical protein